MTFLYSAGALTRNAHSRAMRTRRAAAFTLSACLGFACVSPAVHATDLVEVFRSAQNNDPVYLAAGAANRALYETRPQARALLLPDVQVFGSIDGNRQDIRRLGTTTNVPGASNFFSNTIQLSVTQPVYNKDLFVQLKQADTRVKQANAEFAFAFQDLIFRVADAYFNVLRGEDQLDFAVAQQEANKRQLDQAQQRFDVGLIAITDVEEAKAGFDNATATVIEAENALDNAREALREITGDYYEHLAELEKEIPLVVPEPQSIEEWTETALNQNLELLAARYASEVQRDQIRRAKAGHLPTLNLVGETGLDTSDGDFSNDRQIWDSSVSLQLRLPIYQGGLVLSQTRESRARYQESIDIQEQARRRTQRDAREAYLGVKTQISLVQARDQSVRSAGSALEAIKAGFEVGTRTTADVVDAEQNLVLNQRDYSFARYDYIIEILRLKRAAGTLSDQDLVIVNNWLR
jgi:outer membrane protein